MAGPQTGLIEVKDISSCLIKEKPGSSPLEGWEEEYNCVLGEESWALFIHTHPLWVSFRASYLAGEFGLNPGNSGVVAVSAEPPVGKVTHKVVNERLEILTCQAFGFYPKEIQATWTRDGEPCVYETLYKNVAPNSDGTYYVQLSIDINPKERDCFRCHLEHKGLQEPLVLSLKEETGWERLPFFSASPLRGTQHLSNQNPLSPSLAAMWWIPVGIVTGVIWVVIFLICK
uniref:Ig-like domain-containing protein n=1 Tax=Naja naja TaxID=35670 RepID=A0A8C6VHB8_NAJNA